MCNRPDEISFTGGVFAIAATPDLATGKLFKEKSLPVSRDNCRVLIHDPVHLLGAEALPFRPLRLSRWEAD